MLLSALCLGLAALNPMTAQDFPAPTYFVFLVSGKNPPQATPEEIQKYQMAHIDNFKRLFGEKKLLTAGPCADPEKTKRGIVILTVKNEKEIAECFKPDPYIEKGFMEVEARRASIQFGKINTAAIDPSAIEENRIVVFTKDPNKNPTVPRKETEEIAEYLKETGPAAGLAFYTNFARNSMIRSVALFKGKDDARIQEWIAKSPFIEKGALKATVFPQWLSKGVLQ